MDYAGFLRQQAATLIEQFFADYNRAWIAMPDHDWFLRRASLDGGRVGPLPGCTMAEAAVWRDAKGRAELWVRAEEKSAAGTGLYARAWRQFVLAEAGTGPTSSVDGMTLAVDHLYPETAAARLGMSHVRVMAVDRRANSALGATVEHAAATDKPGSFRPRFATPFTLAKVSAFPGSFARQHSPDVAARALIAHMRSLGYPVPDGALGDLEVSLTASSLEWFRGGR